MKLLAIFLFILTSGLISAREFYVGYSEANQGLLSTYKVVKNYPLLQIAIVTSDNEEDLFGFDFVSRPPMRINLDTKKSERSLPLMVSPQELQWNYKNIDLLGAWKYTKGKGAKVLILDSGIDKNHPSLKQKIAEIVDFTKSKVTPYVPYPGYDITGHGSHIAGVIAGNGNGFTGIAPEAKLYIGKVCIFICRDQTILVDAFEWAIHKRVDVISMSFSNTTFPEEIAQRIFEKLEEHNIVAVAASGNEGKTKNVIGFPAKYPTVLSVGAINSDGLVADFSNYGKELSLVAPGVDIRSTSLTKGINSKDELLTFMSGTSMATPHVSAVAALIRSLDPSLTPKEVRQFILDGAVKNEHYQLDIFGSGILNAKRSLDLVKEP
ncbi:MAG: S8 family peptidase [Bacteriovoracaceae bacterium]|nr:S8 family peptidase [Bacteriovoracaceae bacterium]